MEESKLSPATAAVTRSGKPRQRSAIACRRCHTRRVKCNAAESGIPCTNCERAQIACQLIESKRGRKRTTASVPPSAPDPSSAGNNGTPKLMQFNHPLPTFSPEGTPSQTSSRGFELLPTRERVRSNSEGPETLYAQVLENAGDTPECPSLMKPGGQVVYLGETFNLTYLLHQTNPQSRQPVPKLHVVLPIHPKKGPTNQGPNCDDFTMDLLQRQEAFTLPHLNICRELFRVYFLYVHPHYPILDRREFAYRYSHLSNPPSWLLLQAVLFMGAGHCDVSVLKEVGFKSRYEARLTLFKRTKALYDADHETDKQTIVQSLFLMSFWWNSPTDQKDTWHWLGNSISLALTMGMHRSTRHSDMSLSQQRLWKKIWWSLFAEDKHAAAALGRPVHIRLRDCDVEKLEEVDFEEEPAPDPAIFGVQQRVDILYVLFLSELSKIVERIIEKSFNAHAKTPGPEVDTLQLCEEDLQKWETSLPPELHLSRHSECVWTGMLHIAHSWFRILTHRTRKPEEGRSSRDVAMNAADRIARIIDDVLSTSRINQCPIHVIPALFAAMGMHTVNICSGDPIREQLGSVKIRLSMIALRELQSTWPVSGWIFLLFMKIIRRIRDTDEDPSKSNSETADSVVQAETPSMVDAHIIMQPNVKPPVVLQPHLLAHQHHNIIGWENQDMAMPVDFSTDWSGIHDTDLCLDPEFGFMIGTPRTATPRAPRQNFQ
ncbi:hypothetical protein AJ80_03533 [Polytolypa hystricis UAMH7299]|uniref:Zn(2)-C6 fungal-type domain-containing protein n=1 Tax=Polytolypa hystricis (strain UAMH7299) TaxID=1447883 RepID=A0A2B7YIU0_POLH7|nr:hypothetical protein AJ80_03533 [Polytolypa hystricis UAMH7299]